VLDKHVTRTGDDYAEVLSELLPIGQAWPRDEGEALMQVVRGLCQIWGDFEVRASTLLETESDPRITNEMLPDWERNWGLPDPCYQEPTTVPERQRALVQRMTIEGAQSREFFIGVAAYIGYAITISEFRPFMVAFDRCGDNRVYGDGTPMVNEWHQPVLNPIGVPVANGELSAWPNYGLGPLENRYYWTVHVANARLTWFRCGGGQCGIDPHLLIGMATDLECLLQKWKPAHTQIIFDYSGLTVGGPMAGTP
jgi:uncharacterized protein YmfQ (DUF2313 family)